MQADNKAFVVGVFRSGTSLLTLILNQNPKVALMYECDLWNFPAALMKLRFRHNWAERIEFYNQSLSRHQLVTAANPEAMEGFRVPQDLYDAYAARKGALVCGEKSPFFCSRLEELSRKYPGAAFVFLWRNPTEVYRSVLKAGETSRFFSRPGMLSRMIFLQEEAIRQLHILQKQGARVFHVDYAALVGETDRVCRDLSAFLRVPFDPAMLQLEKADRSAIFKSPHHSYLNRGIIERQKYDRELVPSRIFKKLERFRCRWERQQTDWIKPPRTPDEPQPSSWELFYHKTLGALLVGYDSVIRAGFEFVPLVWLRVYRLLKNWVVNPPSGQADERTSLLMDLKTHWMTICTALVLLGVVAYVHAHINPHLMFVLFYGFPAALVALVVNARWATLFVLIASIISPIIQYDGDSDYRPAFVFIWNFINRLILLEIIVLMLTRVRLELSRVSHHVK